MWENNFKLKDNYRRDIQTLAAAAFRVALETPRCGRRTAAGSEPPLPAPGRRTLTPGRCRAGKRGTLSSPRPGRCRAAVERSEEPCQPGCAAAAHRPTGRTARSAGARPRTGSGARPALRRPRPGSPAPPPFSRPLPRPPPPRPNSCINYARRA